MQKTTQTWIKSVKSSKWVKIMPHIKKWSVEQNHALTSLLCKEINIIKNYFISIKNMLALYKSWRTNLLMNQIENLRKRFYKYQNQSPKNKWFSKIVNQ